MNLISLSRILKITFVLSTLGRKKLKCYICQNFKKKGKRLSLKWRVLELIIFYKVKNQMICMLLAQLKREKKKLSWKK